MSEFNLIPEEYFAAIRRRRLTLLAIGAAMTMVMITAGAIFGANWVLEERESELVKLRRDKVLVEQKQAQLSALQQEKSRLESNLRLMASLQSGAPVTAVVEAVEKAAQPGGVRFDSWSFMRSGIRAGDDVDARPPGFYALSMADQGFPASWESLARMTVEGRARDHAALSLFVQKLFEQPDIEDVHIQKSSQTEAGVEFHLALLISRTGPAT